MKKEYEDEAMSCAQVIAWGIAIMLMFIGLGGCAMLGQSRFEFRYDNTKPESQAVSNLCPSVSIRG